eukprot:TRINITY_DN68702_c0_g1_i1.p1 TRINITY_DN68702_c0_g1~~TRINITY_DN68702_c0_g1_i1.p1  ORF type:complete len:133 (-),score=9.70 TRINITY_DN68702_c0_g1_i1:105-503(-)
MEIKRKMAESKGVIKIQNMDQLKNVFNEAKVVIVDFFANWCGPCKIIAPVLEAEAKEWTVKYPTAAFVTVDVDAFSDFASKAKVTAMPTFKIYKGEIDIDTAPLEVLDEVIGANPEKLKRALSVQIPKNCGE